MAEVDANEKALRLRQDELESHLIAAPAATWEEAAEKARYLLKLFAATLAAEDPRRQKLIAAVLADFERPAEGPHDHLGPSTRDCADHDAPLPQSQPVLRAHPGRPPLFGTRQRAGSGPFCAWS